MQPFKRAAISIVKENYYLDSDNHKILFQVANSYIHSMYSNAYRYKKKGKKGLCAKALVFIILLETLNQLVLKLVKSSDFKNHPVKTTGAELENI